MKQIALKGKTFKDSWFSHFQAPSHNRLEYDRIKSTNGNCQVTPFDIPHEVKPKGVEILSSSINDSNIKLADACSKELDDVRTIVLSYHPNFHEATCICGVLHFPFKILLILTNIRIPRWCSLLLLQLCDILRKKHNEAKELLVQAIVNSNKLLMLNNPQFEEKISFKLYTLYSSIHGFGFHNTYKSTIC